MNIDSHNEAQNLFHEVKDTLTQLIEVLNLLTYDKYVCKNAVINNSTIGEHTRHIIELFQQLINGYECGEIDYDHRKRNSIIQEDINIALASIAEIIISINKKNKILILCSLHSSKEIIIETNYYRELIYNLEHCIHHQAMIKFALISNGVENVNENFGVAKSTIIYRKICVQ